MAKKKIVRKRNKNTKTKPINKDILSISLIIFGLISLVSLFSIHMGIVGKFLYEFYSFLCGSGNFLFPVLFVVWGFLYNSEKYNQKFKNIVLSNIIIVLCLLIFLDGTKSSNSTLIDRISLSIDYLDIATSGGVIGSILGFFMYKLFGSIGTYIILSLIIFFNLYLLLKYNIGDLNRIPEFIGKKYNIIKMKVIDRFEKYRNSNEINNDRNKNSKNKKINLNSESKKESNVVIREYNKVDTEDNSVNSTNYTNLINKKSNNKNIEKIEKKELELNSQKISEEVNSVVEEEYIFPPIELLYISKNNSRIPNDEIINNGKIIEKTMENFGIDCKIVAINKGPVITCYEIEPAPGVKLSKIVALNDNLSLSLASSDIRIEAPIPGKSVVGIEVPNKKKQDVTTREIISSKEFIKLNSKLPLALGKNVSGDIVISSIDKMPHLLIAGATGSGKSVCINTIISSIIYKSSPKDVKLMLIDPKVVELNIYNGIPHLLIPVVTDPKKAAFALNWAVGEMEKRYKYFAENSVRDIGSYNAKMKKLNREDEVIPKIVIIVDELADLMMVSQSEVEDYIARLAQMARAAGIHLIIATQRPSVDVITGTIKANIPSRIAFSVSSAVDSRTILDMSGAEKLLGKGDMLFYPSFYSKPVRIQGSFISDEEVENVVNFVKANSKIENNYTEKITKEIEKKKEKLDKDMDPLFKEAIEYILDNEQASISFLQRKLKIGYSRAARIVDQMEELNIIGPSEGSKPRKLFMGREDIMKLLGEEDE
ncbi:MAG: DNA translocase FtsK 4TM domain-containing protein [Peptoniphilaceae bacterium]